MKRFLLVDDDPVVLRLYQERLLLEGAQVEAAGDGLAAINSLRARRPDLVVLDLMMPKLTGVDVLKFIRSQPDLKTLPVVVLSNSYMNRLAAEATALGVQKALLKVRCSPTLLVKTIDEVLTGEATGGDSSHLLAVPELAAPAAPAPSSGKPGVPAARASGAAESGSGAEFQRQARLEFLRQAPATCAALRTLCRAVANAPAGSARDIQLQNLYRKVHFITATAGLAQCYRLAQTAAVFEALLFELIGKPDRLSPSALRTTAATVDFLALLFDCARDAERDVALTANTLVVDDDALNNRLVVGALQLAQLKARSTNDPHLGLQWLAETRFDLVLLDIEMPGMNGFEFCRRLRKLPDYQQTAVIFVTGHSDFESRAEGIASGGDDLISKPIFPLELSVKAVSHLLRRQMAT